MTRQEVLEQVTLDINPFSHRPRLVVRTNTNIACRDLTDTETIEWAGILNEYIFKGNAVFTSCGIEIEDDEPDWEAIKAHEEWLYD